MAHSYSLTPEQQAVVTHPRGKHARVLAVAGSGKTTTMAHRIKYLLQETRVAPKSICILMFNRLARIQFAEKLEQLGISDTACPAVNTFHSYAYGLIGKAAERGWIKELFAMWIGDHEELVRRTVHEAIRNIAQLEDEDPETVDADEVQEAIGLWKGALIPPERAGHRGSSLVPLVYKEFERLRTEANGLTFDDFVPLAVDILEYDLQHTREFVGHYDYVIVDEYQDINYGQQRLIELLAGNRADIMVVGDDDQTIYEWRGARPEYILDFGRVFNNKPYADYTLSRSFRFGPVIAQCAQNVIEFNNRRVSKRIVAHNANLPSQLHVIMDKSGHESDVSKELTEQAIQLVKECGDPQKLIVLGRMYAQLNSLETEFLARGIPYRVEGRAPFFKRREIQALLDYIRLALTLDTGVNQRAETLLLSIANTPNRKLSRKHLTYAMRQASGTGRTTRDVMGKLTDYHSSPLTRNQREGAEELLNVLDRLNEILYSTPEPNSGHVVGWLVETVDFASHFEHYYGRGEASEDRKRTIAAFRGYADTIDKPVPEFLDHVDNMDTTRGVPEDQQIVFTTVFRTKGLEYDYVILPSCEEGYMPILFGTDNLTYDLKGIVDEPEQSEIIENERRLFYVAITRARKAVFIGTAHELSSNPQPGKSSAQVSRFIHETEHVTAMDVMTPLQQFADGNTQARSRLLTATEANGSNKRVMNSLLQDYLVALGDMHLIAEVRAIVSQKPEKPFKYAEPPQSISINREPSTKGSTQPRWWDDAPF